MSGVVYVIDGNNEVIREFEMDYHDAVSQYFNQRDPKTGNRYYVGVKGGSIPFKRKKKKLYDILTVSRQESDKSEESNPEQ